MAKKKTTKRLLRAGQGATAEVLTQMIRPHVVYDNQTQRSRVVIVDLVDKNKKYHYTFHLKDRDNTKIYNASIRYCSIVEEGDPSKFFKVLLSSKLINTNTDDFEEPEIPWKKSKARKLLYDDVREGRVPLKAKDENGQKTTDISKVYSMHPEYADYDFDKFQSRLSGIRKTITNKNSRANDDKASFDNFCANHTISTVSCYGYSQWQGSSAQKLVKEHIKDGTLESYTKAKYEYPKMAYWLSRQEFYDEFPLYAFRDKIKQEI